LKTIQKGQPERLLNESYMSSDTLFRMFQHEISVTIPIHWHEFFEIAFVSSGEGTHILNGTSYPLRRGALFLLSPADFHEIIAAPGSVVKLYNMIFSERALKEDLYYEAFQHASKLHYLFPEDQCTAIEADFERIRQELNGRPRFGSTIIVQGALEKIIIELARALRVSSAEGALQGSRGHRQLGSGDSYTRQFANGEGPLQTVVRKTLTYIQHHFRESITLRDAAQQAGLSPNYYSECFHKQFGLSFQSYLQELRLQFAASLLRVSELPITEICFAAGFNTLSHFERLFKRRFGHSPRAFRRMPD